MTAAARAGKAQSWEAFKAEAFGTRTEVIEGVEIPVPADIPLNFTAKFSSLSEESEIDDFADAVTLLYGEGVFEQWVNNGLGQMGLLTVLMWGYMQGSGQKDVEFGDAYRVVMSDDPGKAAAAAVGNRAARRSQSKGTGGRSSRTSAASTGSPRARSRT
ncbi:hypothetical protein ABT024_06820 [Streptomyces sp. NPDC002812]|uniref:hypothetical protein n=1 Tax=Streptomyces sp. NPDC002812 TaxID=3154434 RepID=UPI00332B57D3